MITLNKAQALIDKVSTDGFAHVSSKLVLEKLDKIIWLVAKSDDTEDSDVGVSVSSAKDLIENLRITTL